MKFLFSVGMIYFFSNFFAIQAQNISQDSLLYWLHPKNVIAEPGKELLKTFQFIPGETIKMGSSYDTLYPVNQVTIYDFFIQNTEVTNIFYKTFLLDLINDSTETVWRKFMPKLNCWSEDFPEDSLEELDALYFLHPEYSYFPVVGVSWEQSLGFAQWAEKKIKKYLEVNPKMEAKYRMGALRLASEAEWEFAAGGVSNIDYPWGMGGTESIYCLDAKGKRFLANFMPGTGDYSLDGYDITAPTASFPPNMHRLFDMAGNVSEWCSDSYIKNRFHDSLFTKSTGFRTQLYDHSVDKISERVVKGGSWKDTSAFLRVYSREGIPQNQQHSFIGFRLAASRQGD